MKKLKRIAFKSVILYVVFFVVMSSIASTYAVQQPNPVEVGDGEGGSSGPTVRYFTEADGQTVANYAINFINNEIGDRQTCYDTGTSNPGWKSDGRFHVCCTTGVALMYQNALGINIYDLGFSTRSSTGISNMLGSPNWQQITSSSEIRPGDIVMRDGHTEMYVGNSKNANFGSSPSNKCVKLSGGPRYKTSGDHFEYAFRLVANVEIDPNAPVTSGSLGNLDSGIYNKYFTEGKFYFRGVPDGTYSVVARKNIFQIIVDAVKEIANFLAGLMTYLFRGVIISIISVFDRLLNTTIQSMNGDPENDSVTLEESGMDSTNADMQDREGTVSIEGILFNDIDLFDANIFRID